LAVSFAAVRIQYGPRWISPCTFYKLKSVSSARSSEFARIKLIYKAYFNSGMSHPAIVFWSLMSGFCSVDVAFGLIFVPRLKLSSLSCSVFLLDVF